MAKNSIHRRAATNKRHGSRKPRKRARFIPGKLGSWTREQTGDLRTVVKNVHDWWQALGRYEALQADVAHACRWVDVQREYARESIRQRIAAQYPGEHLDMYVEQLLQPSSSTMLEITAIAARWLRARYPRLAKYSPTLSLYDTDLLLHRSLTGPWEAAPSLIIDRITSDQRLQGRGARIEIWQAEYRSTREERGGYLPIDDVGIHPLARLTHEGGLVQTDTPMPTVVITCMPGTTQDDLIAAANDAWVVVKGLIKERGGEWNYAPDYEGWIGLYNDFMHWCESHPPVRETFLTERERQRLDRALRTDPHDTSGYPLDVP